VKLKHCCENNTFLNGHWWRHLSVWNFDLNHKSAHIKKQMVVVQGQNDYSQAWTWPRLHSKVLSKNGLELSCFLILKVINAVLDKSLLKWKSPKKLSPLKLWLVLLGSLARCVGVCLSARSLLPIHILLKQVGWYSNSVLWQVFNISP
jgi:hypothetical protein